MRGSNLFAGVGILGIRHVEEIMMGDEYQKQTGTKVPKGTIPSDDILSDETKANIQMEPVSPTVDDPPRSDSETTESEQE